ncbi:MAG: DUF294 nucleotidyltransferase-like domain-containing protein [Coriobacteriia bacterium]
MNTRETFRMSYSSLPDADELWAAIPPAVVSTITPILEARDFSDRLFSTLAPVVSHELETCAEGSTLILVGSLARKEAHLRSDVDSFVTSRDGCDAPQFAELQAAIESVTSTFGAGDGLSVAESGHFSAGCSIESLVQHIGGDEDTNISLTRRMLVLLESVELDASGVCSVARQRILDRYLLEIQADGRNRPVFLLNDMLRFYRTMCVDYEHKRTEKGKNWGVRLVKLRHSRKLLYVTGLLPLLECMSMEDQSERIQWLSDMYGLTPLERLIYFILDRGVEGDWVILERYADFLEFMMDDRRRSLLDNLDFEQRRDREEYVVMQQNAWDFRERIHGFLMSDHRWRDQIVRYVLS